MAAHRLHRANVRAVLEEVGREGMADDVRGDSLSDAGLSCIVFYDSLHTAAVQTAEFFASIFFFVEVFFSVSSTLTNSPSSMSLRAERYFFKAARARSEIKTTLTLPPFPRTESSSELAFRLREREQSSPTRRPVEKSISSIALSRRFFISPPIGASSSRSSSAGVMRSRERSDCFASSIMSDAIAGISLLER